MFRTSRRQRISAIFLNVYEMKVGDIVKIFAPVAGYKKYHFCICLPSDAHSSRFLYLNSDPSFKDCLSISCDRIPMIPASETGVTAISFSVLARYSAAKLELYGAEVIGEMPSDVIDEMIEFVATVRSLPRADKAAVTEALRSLRDSKA